MIGPIFFVLLAGLLIVLPAIAGWTVSKKRDLGVRLFCTIIGGQFLFLPAIGFIAFYSSRADGDDPWKMLALYAAVATIVSIMTLASLEIRKTHKEQ